MTGNILKGPDLAYQPTISMGEVFFDSMERFGRRICQIDARLNKKETYSDVKRKCVRTALELLRRRISSEDVIVLCTKVTLENIVPIIAAFFLGAKVANLDPTLSVRHIAHLLSLVSPKMIFVEEESVGLIEKSLGGASWKATIVVFGKTTKYTSFSEFVKSKDNEIGFKPAKMDIHDISIIFFSSGTTGLPKAICHSHYSFLNMAHSFTESTVNCNVILAFATFYWVSEMLNLTASFIVGGHRVFSGPMEPEQTYTIIDKHKVTTLVISPMLVVQLINFDEYSAYNISSVANVIIGGAPMSSTQLEQTHSVFKHSNIIFVYGSTEAGVISSFNPTTEQRFLLSKIGSCGTATRGMFIKIADVLTHETVGADKKGEICVKSCAMMKGYYKTDSSEVFDSDGFLKTGDVGYYDQDECLYVVERIREMFKYMMFHVVPTALEAVLLEHPAVKEAVVFGTPTSGEDGELPTACVVLKEKDCVKKEEIEEFVAERVSDYEKLRGGVTLVDQLQRTSYGKLMRKEIRNVALKKTKK